MQLYSITHLHSRSFILCNSCKTHSCCYMNILGPVIHPHPETPLGARTCYPSCWEWCRHTAFSCQLPFENDLAEERCLSQALGLSLRVAELHWLTHRGVHRASLLPQFQTSLMGDYIFKTLCSAGNLPKESVGTSSKLTFSFCPVLPAPFTSVPADPSSTSRSRLEPVQLSSVHLLPERPTEHVKQAHVRIPPFSWKHESLPMLASIPEATVNILVYIFW